MKIWFMVVLVWLDQGINAVFGPLLNRIFKVSFFGSADETLSSVFGKNRESCVICNSICWILDRFDPGHCANNIETDEHTPYAR